jgi:hypothetical protein
MRFVLFLLFLQAALAAEPVRCDAMLQYAKTSLPSSGILKQNPDGFAYVDIDDGYIHELIRFIDGFEEPPYFNRIDSVGAHISVIYASESRKIPHLGEKIEFQVKSCELVPISSILGMKAESIFLILVDAPELDQMREQAGLPPIRGGMHIAVGIINQSGKQVATSGASEAKPN